MVPVERRSAMSSRGDPARSDVGHRRRRRAERPCARATAPTSGPRSTTVTDSAVGDRRAARRRPRLEVPRVVRDGMVGRQLEHGADAAGGQQLAAACDVDDRVEVAVEVPAHGEVAVGHRAVGDDDAVVDGDRRERRRSRGPAPRRDARGRPSASRCTGPSPGGTPSTAIDLVAIERRRRWPRAGPAGASSPSAVGDPLARARRRRGRGPPRRRRGPRRSTSREDVVELLGQHLPPERRRASAGRPSPRRRPPTARPRAAAARSAGCRASCGAGWSACRGGSRSTARRATPAPARRAATSASTWSKNSRRRPELDAAACRRGRPAGARRSSISRVGPPPPSP